MSELKLEINARYEQSPKLKKLEERGILITPPIGGDNDWLFRVDVGHGQAVVGFLKFLTIGIGFQVEDDWNTNLPYRCEAEKIYEHIKKNKTDGPTEEDCIEAIRMIQDAVRKLRGPEE